ncbi:MAG: hypothetical protein LBU42_01770 [Prevotellaceae bacterium]|jgi:uncharacterized protein (TIGR02145 family)|nr:hypothetical protein [Prevotellaceae bacterium]
MKHFYYFPWLSLPFYSRCLLFTAVFLLTGKAAAQDHIKITPIGITYINNSPVVKFRIQWNAVPNDNEVHNTKIWVWVDYHKVENHQLSGKWMRATISGVSAGTIASGSKGFWLQGNAGAYSQDLSVTLSGTPPKFNWCAYTSDAEPVAEFIASNTIRFYGSEPFRITYTDKSVAENLPRTPYTPAAGKEIAAFTDATGCPGIVKYSMKAPILSGGGSYCAASATLTCLSERGINYQLQQGGAATGDVQAGTGNALTWTVRASGNYMLSATHTATAATATSNQQKIKLYEEPVAPTGLETNIATICNTVFTPVLLTATGGSKGSGAVYEWGTGETPGSNPLSPATTTANTYATSPNGATAYWVRMVGNTFCENTTAAATVSIDVYAPFTAGGIVSDTTIIKIGDTPNVTVLNNTEASGGGALISYQWRRTGTRSAVLAGDSTGYVISSDATNYNASGTYYFNRYAKNDVCNTGWEASEGQYTLIVEDYDPDQGYCTFVKPPVVGTFANFPSSYSASTYVSLTDERDGKNYVVIKLGNRWMMAQNLNFQQGLIWHDGSKKYSETGSFWCPSRHGSKTTSTRIPCNIWGALYTWEAAMMVDGKWQDEAKNNSKWPGASCRGNGGKGANGRGICPPNWHVPTDSEWGEVLNLMETGSNNHASGSTGELGTNAGTRGKANCVCLPGTISCDAENANVWKYDSRITNTDDYGFRVLPAGFRYTDGTYFITMGEYTYFWSSTCGDTSTAWVRIYSYDRTTVKRMYTYRSSGFSVRCIQNL